MRKRRGFVAIAVGAALLVSAPLAFAHIERASYWPSPAFDGDVNPAAGGQVPKTRGLFSALDAKPPGKTRVVCQGKNSLKKLRGALKVAQTRGYKLRLSGKRKHIGEKKAERLLDFNERLFEKCNFDSIQDAVNAAGNNDRIVVMPGVYTEPDSRAAPTNDPKCADLLEENDESETDALSYAYHLK